MAKKWRLPLAIGLIIGIARPLTNVVEKALQPRLGVAGSLLVGLIVVVLVSLIVALIVTGLFGRKAKAEQLKPTTTDTSFRCAMVQTTRAEWPGSTGV